MTAARSLYRNYDSLLNRLIIHHQARWIGSFIAFGYMIWRVAIYGYLGLMYFSGLYLLYLAVQFYTPMGLPDPDEDDFNTTTQQLYTMVNGDDRPLLRNLTEFAFWKQTTLIITASILCTFFDVFLIPVYWPFLLGYFIALIFFAVRKHLKHMRKYGYCLQDFQRKGILAYDFAPC